MRLSFAQSSVLVLVSTLVGCSSINTSQFWPPRFSTRTKKPATASSSELASAPSAPSFNSATAAAPTVSMGPAQGTGNLPVYPGTTYPVTPYPASTPPTHVAANPYAGYSPEPYGATPPAAAQSGGGYPNNPYAGAPANPYTPGSTSSYAQQSPAYNPPAPPAGPYNASEQSGTITR